jgi:PleD family two-component response regulator
MNVLIIEDSVLEREYISRILNMEYINTWLSENGEEGIEIARVQEFDAILLDIIMPGLNGYEVCKLLKKDSKNRYTPVIFITGNNDNESLQAAFEAGGVDFISKPVNKYNVLARVKIHVENNNLIKNLKKEVEIRKRIEVELKEANEQYTSQNEELMQIIAQLDEAKNALEEKDRKIKELLYSL